MLSLLKMFLQTLRATVVDFPVISFLLFKARVGCLKLHCRGEHNACFPSSTSGATSASFFDSQLGKRIILWIVSGLLKTFLTMSQGNKYCAFA